MNKTLNYLRKKRSCASAPSGTKEAEDTITNKTRDSPTTATLTEVVKSNSPIQRRKGLCNKMLVLQQDRTHTKVKCRTRKNQKKITWRNKEVKSKYLSHNIFALIDLEDLDKIKELTHKMEEEAKLMELPKTQDF